MPADSWDDLLEGATGLLDGLTGGSRSGRVAIRTEHGWVVDFRASGRAVSTQGAIPGDTLPRPLNDYQLAVLYGGGYRPTGNEGRPTGFVKTLTLGDGFRWDEQTLREIVLEALGILRFVLGAGDAAEASLENATRAPSILPRPKLRRRR